MKILKDLRESIKFLQKNIAVKYFLVIAVLCVGCLGLVKPFMQSAFNPDALQVSAAKKKLPIYCVDTDEKKVAISFDAAWGNG